MGFNGPSVEDLRGFAKQNVMLLLQASDIWVMRAFEDGVPLAQDRLQYRSELRACMAAIEQAEDPTTIDVPGPPIYKGTA